MVNAMMKIASEASMQTMPHVAPGRSGQIACGG